MLREPASDGQDIGSPPAPASRTEKRWTRSLSPHASESSTGEAEGAAGIAAPPHAAEYLCSLPLSFMTSRPPPRADLPRRRHTDPHLDRPS